MESEGGKKEGRRRIPNAGEVMKERGSEGGGSGNRREERTRDFQSL